MRISRLFRDCFPFWLLGVMTLLVSLNLSLDPAFAALESTGIKQLTMDMKGFDGRLVTIQGEAVGEIMRRGKGTWLNIDDGTETMGIWVPNALMPEIDFVGNYKEKGDIIRIIGTFNKACPEHGGETDIHAREVIRIRSGHPTAHPVSNEKKGLTILLFVLAAGATGFYKWLKKGQ